MVILNMAYKCEYCSKVYIRKYHCESHESTCYKNPKNDHVCFRYCKYLAKIDKTEFGTLFICQVSNDYMYSFKAEKSRTLRSMLNKLGERMPLFCKHYEQGENNI